MKFNGNGTILWRSFSHISGFLCAKVGKPKILDKNVHTDQVFMSSIRILRQTKYTVLHFELFFK